MPYNLSCISITPAPRFFLQSHLAAWPPHSSSLPHPVSVRAPLIPTVFLAYMPIPLSTLPHCVQPLSSRYFPPSTISSNSLSHARTLSISPSRLAFSLFPAVSRLAPSHSSLPFCPRFLPPRSPLFPSAFPLSYPPRSSPHRHSLTHHSSLTHTSSHPSH